MEGKSLDYLIIAIYLTAVALFGIIRGGKQKSVNDYFLGSDKVPWWAVCFSIVAAETSTLTFISIPGLAYLTNMNFLQVTAGYLLGRIAVAYWFIPAYYKGELSTAYSYLEKRFGGSVRSYASVVFLFTRMAADGVRLFATAIPLKLLLGIDYPLAIIIIAIVSLIYTFTGGVKGVIWVDVVQMFIYIGGALTAMFYVTDLLPDGWQSVLSAANDSDKLSVIYTGIGMSLKEFFAAPYTLAGGLIGGAFLSMASHGTDQLIVQRLLAAKDLSASRKAVVGSGVIIIFQFFIFLLLGVMLYAYFGKMDIKSDEIFPLFIIEVLPPGVTGIIIAGLFAAAMSTLAGSMSSLSSSSMLDLYLPLVKLRPDEKKSLLISRLFTVIWCVLLILSAFFFMETSRAVVEIALSIASFTYGGLLGTFLLGIFVPASDKKHALIAFTTGILCMTVIIILQITAWTWFTFTGVLITLTTGIVLSKIDKIKDVKIKK